MITSDFTSSTDKWRSVPFEQECSQAWYILLCVCVCVCLPHRPTALVWIFEKCCLLYMFACLFVFLLGLCGCVFMSVTLSLTRLTELRVNVPSSLPSILLGLILLCAS
jgi:hypothetical protein